MLDGHAVGARLSEQQQLTTYAQWVSTYDATSVLDPKPLPALQTGIGSRYLLLVRSLHLGRERIRAADAGYTGFASDANNVWRTDLKISAELVDAEVGRVVWKGTGYAENINSPRKALDYGLVIVNQRNSEVLEFVDKLVSTASDGLARQLAAPSGRSAPPGKAAR